MFPCRQASLSADKVDMWFLNFYVEFTLIKVPFVNYVSAFYKKFNFYRNQMI